jgi:small subunit ribosomal protein S2
MIAEPGCVFIVDCVKEANAVKEATRLGIPVVAIVDTNADPEPIDYVVPGNDDSVNGVKLILEGLTKVIKTANDEYSAKAAEENKKRESERKSREEAEKAARAERKARAGAKPAGERRSSSKKGIGADVKAAARAAKEAAESKAKADLAAKRKAAVAEAEAAVAAAEAAPAAEAPAAE